MFPNKILKWNSRVYIPFWYLPKPNVSASCQFKGSQAYQAEEKSSSKVEIWEPFKL